MEGIGFASSFIGTPVQQGRAISVRKTATSVRVTVPQANYNYNIYQDGAERSKRFVGSGDRAVTIAKPLGIILEEGNDGMCFVESMDPNGNAAKTGQVQVGDIIVACSATFGDEVWSTRGVGLGKIMKSISVRQGNLVTLVLESPSQVAEQKKSAASTAAQRRVEAREKFGEREVLDPNTWGVSKQTSPPQEVTDFAPAPVNTPEGYKEIVDNTPAFTPQVSEEELRRQIEEESGKSEGDNSIVIGSVAMAVGLAVLILFLSR